MATSDEPSFDDLNDVTGGAGAGTAQTKPAQLFEIEHCSFDIEQVPTIGSR